MIILRLERAQLQGCLRSAQMLASDTLARRSSGRIDLSKQVAIVPDARAAPRTGAVGQDQDSLSLRVTQNEPTSF